MTEKSIRPRWQDARRRRQNRGGYRDGYRLLKDWPFDFPAIRGAAGDLPSGIIAGDPGHINHHNLMHEVVWAENGNVAPVLPEYSGAEMAALAAPEGTVLRRDDGIRGLWVKGTTKFAHTTGEVVDVKRDFGMVGDATNETSKLYDAIVSAPVGSKLWIPRGDYSVNLDMNADATIAAKIDALNIEGAGQQTVLRAFDATLPVVKGVFTAGTVKRNLGIRNINLVGSGATATAHGLSLEYVYDSSFENVTIQNPGGDAVRLNNCVGQDWWSPRIITPGRYGWDVRGASNAIHVFGGRTSGDAAGTDRGASLNGAALRFFAHVFESWYIGANLAELANSQSLGLIGCYFENCQRSDVALGPFNIDGLLLEGSESSGQNVGLQFLEAFSGAYTVKGFISRANRSVQHVTRTYTFDGGTFSDSRIGPDIASESTYVGTIPPGVVIDHPSHTSPHQVWKKFTITHADLTEATNNTAQQVSGAGKQFSVLTGDVVHNVIVKVVTPFTGGGATQVNVRVCDNGSGNELFTKDKDVLAASANTYVATGETATDKGTRLYDATEKRQSYFYAAAGAIQTRFQPDATHNLNALTAGELEVWLLLSRPL